METNKGDMRETRKQALIVKSDTAIKETGYGTLETRKWSLIKSVDQKKDSS